MQFASLILLFLGAAAVTSAPVEYDASSNIIAAIASLTSRDASVLSQLDQHLNLRDDDDYKNNNNNNNNNDNCKGGNGNNNGNNKNCSSNKNTCNSNQNSCSRSDDRKNTNCCCR